MSYIIVPINDSFFISTVTPDELTAVINGLNLPLLAMTIYHIIDNDVMPQIQIPEIESQLDSFRICENDVLLAIRKINPSSALVS